MKEVSISLMYLCQHENSGYKPLYNRYMTSNQCGVLFSDIDLPSFVYHNVHGHHELAIIIINIVKCETIYNQNQIFSIFNN